RSLRHLGVGLDLVLRVSRRHWPGENHRAFARLHPIIRHVSAEGFGPERIDTANIAHLQRHAFDETPALVGRPGDQQERAVLRGALLFDFLATGYGEPVRIQGRDLALAPSFLWKIGVEHSLFTEETAAEPPQKHGAFALRQIPDRAA